MQNKEAGGRVLKEMRGGGGGGGEGQWSRAPMLVMSGSVLLQSRAKAAWRAQ